MTSGSISEHLFFKISLGASPDPPSISMLCMLIVLCKITHTIITIKRICVHIHYIAILTLSYGLTTQKLPPMPLQTVTKYLQCRLSTIGLYWKRKGDSCILNSVVCHYCLATSWNHYTNSGGKQIWNPVT